MNSEVSLVMSASFLYHDQYVCVIRANGQMFVYTVLGEN